MKAKIQIQLTEAQLKWLDQEAARTGESRSAIVRTAINEARAHRLAMRGGMVCEVTHGKE